MQLLWSHRQGETREHVGLKITSIHSLAVQSLSIRFYSQSSMTHARS